MFLIIVSYNWKFLLDLSLKIYLCEINIWSLSKNKYKNNEGFILEGL
jgi:hypothetical protein